MTSSVKVWREIKQLNKFLNMSGEILVWTKITVAPSGFEEQAPYFVGIVKLETGERMTLQIVDCPEEHLEVGKRVRLVVRKIGRVEASEVVRYGVKAKLL